MRAAKKTGVDRKILQELVPLNALSPERFREVSDKILIEEVKSGRYLFRKGDRDNQSIYLLEGQIKLVDGFRKVASEIESGTDISRYPISNMQPRTVSARAARKSVIARIDSSLLDAFLTWDQENGAEAVEIGADENSDWLTRMLQSEAFMKIPPSTIQSLLMKMQSVEVHAGDTIIQQGDEGDYFYTIQKGRCVVSRRDESGVEQRLAELTEGDSFGEEALVSDANRNAAVSMLTDGVLMRLAKDDFIALLQEPLVKRVNYETAAAMVDAGAVWVDVRTPDEYEVGSFEDSVNIPLATLRGEIPELVFNAQYVMCCDTGRRSGSAAFLLSHRGLDVYVLDGGIAGLDAGALYQTGPSDRPSAITGEDFLETEELVGEPVEYEDVLQEPDDFTEDVAVSNAAAVPAGDEADSPATNATVTADLEAEVETLRSRNEALGTELAQFRLTEARLTEQLELLRGELGESSEKLADLYSRASSDADKNEQLREENARLQENHARQLQTVQSELDEARQQLGSLQSQTGVASEQQQRLLDEATAGQQASQEEITQLREELAQARSQVQTAGEELAATGAANETLQAEHAAVLQEQHERIAGLQDALEQADQEREQLRNQLSASNEAIEVSESGLYAELQERIALSDRLQAELATLQQQSQEAAESLAAGTARSKELETQGTELEARVESLQRELEDRSQKMEHQVAAAEAERQALERRIEELDSESRQGSEQISEVSAEHEAAVLKIQSLEQELEGLRATQQETVAQLQEQTMRADTLEAGQQAAEQALEGEQAERESERARHSEEAGALRQTIEELQGVQAERDDWQQRSGAQVEENTQLQQELASLKEQIATHTESAGEQLQALQSSLEASQQHNTELEQAVTDRDAQLAGLQEELAGGEAGIREREQQLEGLRQELAEHEERARVAEQENQESIRKAHEDLTRKNDNEKELQGQIGRLRKKLQQATLEQQQVHETAQADIDTIREELHAERQARAEERAEMGARQRELKEQLTAVASEHESNLHSRSGAIEEARDAAREEERVRLQDLLQSQQQTEAQLQNLQQELQQAHAEIARQHQQEKERRQAEADLLQEQKSREEETTAQLESRLKQLTQERDQSLEEQQALREKLSTLRGEVEVARGLMNTGKEGRIEDPAQLRSELEEARRNVDISVRLRAEAESARDVLIQERDGLREQLESSQDAGLPLHVPALDEGETGASHAGPQQADAPRLSSSHAGVTADVITGVPHQVEAGREHSWFGKLAGVAVVGIAALVFWLMLDLEDSGQHSGSDVDAAFDEPALQDAQEPVVETPPLAVAPPEAAVAGEPPVQAAQPAPVAVDSTPVAVQAVTESNTPVARTEPEPEQVIQKPDVPEPEVAAVPALTAGPVFRDKLKNGSKGPLMVELLGASYMMGSPGNSLNFDEGPRHRVMLKGYSISKHEVSFAEYDRFARATGRRLPHDEGWGRGDRPAINIAWQDANAYTAWLSKQTGKNYRLPTESEWEFAIRGGSTDQRWWGSESDTAPANCFNCGSQWDGSRTAPVGSFIANAFGLHDMAGNVQEWVQDCYHAGYAGAPEDGSAWLTPGCTQRVVRGGAYTSPQDTLRSAKRGQYDQDTRLDNLGFRVVREN